MQQLTPFVQRWCYSMVSDLSNWEPLLHASMFSPKANSHIRIYDMIIYNTLYLGSRLRFGEKPGSLSHVASTSFAFVYFDYLHTRKPPIRYDLRTDG